MSRRSKGKRSQGNRPAASSSPGAGQALKPSPLEVHPHNRWLPAAVCLFLALAVWAVFGQTRHFEFINYDDKLYVYDNPTVNHGLSWSAVVGAFTHVYHIVWFPLTSISHMLDFQLYGLNPAGHHLTNVLLHTANAILLFLVLRKLTGALWPAAFVAAVFAIHPLRVESVAWVAERKDVLSGLFFMLTLLAYAHYAQPSKIKNQKSKIWCGLALLFFVLGLLSKSMLVTLPFVLLLLDYWPLRRLPRERLRGNKPAATAADCWPLVLEKIPFLLLAIAAGMVTLMAQKIKVEQVHGFTLPWRAGNALLAYVDYLGHMIYPVGLALIYPPPGRHLPISRVVWSALVLLLISAGVIAGRRRHPYLLMGWLWYLCMLLPVIDVMQAGDQARADRYTYLPQIGLYIMLAWGVAELCSDWRYRRIVLGSAAAVVLAALLIVAYLQTGYWRNSISIWTRTLACTSGNPMAHNNLGWVLADRGKLPEAIQQYELALQLDPHYAEALNNLGLALEKQGKLDEAIHNYEQAIQFDPDDVEANNNLSVALEKQGRLGEAIQHYERALELDPKSAEAHYNLANALDAQGKSSEAIQNYEQAIQLDPEFAKAWNNLGNALSKQGKLDEAIQHYEWAIKLNPDYADAECNLGIALTTQGKLAEAVQQYMRALALNPDYVDAHYNLGVVLAEQGKLPEAVQQYDRVLQLDPGHAKAHYNLGNALITQGKLEEALQHYERALQLNPNYAEAQCNAGLALAALGKLAAARLQLQQALNLATAQKNSPLAEAIRVRLESIQPAPPSPHTP